jgi:predicted Zn-dependent protease
MRQCLAKRKQPTLSPVDKNILKAGPHHCLALCLAALKQNKEADKAFRDALEQDPKSRQVQFDYARFLADNGNGVEALKCIHQLIQEDPSNPLYWQFGGQVALSRPEFIEFALDWTGEAIQFFPAHVGLMEQRAQALLLNGRLQDALPLWRHLGASANPAHRAALALCLAALDEPMPAVPEEMAARVNQEFLAWYRRLLATNAGAVIRTLNERIDSLRVVVPGAVQMIEAALAEANATP